MRRGAASALKSSLITVEGEAIITQTGRGAKDASVPAAAVDGELRFMGHELRLTRLLQVPKRREKCLKCEGQQQDPACPSRPPMKGSHDATKMITPAKIFLQAP